MIVTELFKNRPFALLCAVFMSASLLCFLVQGKYKLIVAAVLAALGIAALIADISGRRVKFAKLALVFVLPAILACLVSYSYFDFGYESVRRFDGEDRTVEGVVIETKSYAEHSSVYTVRITSVDGEKTNIRARLECGYSGSLVIGDRFRMKVDLFEPEDTSHGYSTKLNSISDGITLFALSHSENDCVLLGTANDDPEVFFAKLRTALSVRLARAVGGEAGDLASAVLLADRSGLNPETERDFSRSGVSHILALSGLHMGIIAAISEWILRRIAVPKRMRCIAISLSMVAYLALTGFNLSAVRSVVMLCAVYLSYIISTPTDTKTVLFATGFVIFLINPCAVCDAGFWMSFLATLGIITVSPHAGKLFATECRGSGAKQIIFRFLRYLLSAVSITLVANFAVIFISWLCFGSVSVIAPITNILLSPLSGVLIFLSAMTLITYFVFSPLSELMAELTRTVGDLMLDIAAEFSEMRNIVISLEYDFAGVIIVLFAISTFALLAVKLKHKQMIFVPAVTSVVAFAVCLGCFNAINEGKVNAVYLREKGGEMLVLCENGKTAICDISEGYLSRLNLATLVSSDYYATEVEVLILTHYHSRHPVTLEVFFSCVRLRELWAPRPEDALEVEYLELIYAAAKKAGVKLTVYERGKELRLFSRTALTVLPYDKLSRSVEPLNCVTVENGGHRLTYLGSALGESEHRDAASEYVADSKTVVFGIHGPDTKRTFFFDVGAKCENVIFADEYVMRLFYGSSLPSELIPTYAPQRCDFILE